MRIARIAVRPADRLAWLDVDAERVEPDVRAVCLAPHGDLDDLSASAGRRPDDEGGEETPAGLDHAPARKDHWATLASSDAGTCHSTTWTCGSSTPGWPAL